MTVINFDRFLVWLSIVTKIQNTTLPRELVFWTLVVIMIGIGLCCLATNNLLFKTGIFTNSQQIFILLTRSGNLFWMEIRIFSEIDRALYFNETFVSSSVLNVVSINDTRFFAEIIILKVICISSYIFRM